MLIRHCMDYTELLQSIYHMQLRAQSIVLIFLAGASPASWIIFCL